MAPFQMINDLFKHGLGELHVLHFDKGKLVFGHIVFEKGRLVIKDNNLLSGFKAAQFAPCWESGMLGVICLDPKEHKRPWEAITFYGLEQCNIPLDLSQTRHGALLAAQNQYGDKLVDFVGSVYRGYQLMMENHFLPIVMLKKASTRNGLDGLVVCDLRAAPMPISLINSIHDEVSQSVEKNLILTIDENLTLDDSEFNQMFKDYLPSDDKS